MVVDVPVDALPPSALTPTNDDAGVARILSKFMYDLPPEEEPPAPIE
jgi:hypothetical protein